MYTIDTYHYRLSEIQRENYLSLCITCILVTVLILFVFSVDVGKF
jgi:energy-coupling factor transporter transmembrane protein EcfT